jgi:hypothetical protein
VGLLTVVAGRCGGKNSTFFDVNDNDNDGDDDVGDDINKTSKCKLRQHEMYAELHFKIRGEMWMKLSKEHWYGTIPNSVQKSDESTVTIVWNQQ